MTKSTITRERLEKIKSWRETYGAGSNVMLPAEEAEELSRMALAAMDSEPVAEVLSSRPGNDTSTIDRALPVGTQLYRHAQPAPVVRIGPKINSKMFNADVIFGYEKGKKEVIENIKAAGIEVKNE